MKDVESIRKDNKLDQLEMAQELGISKRSYLYRIENNDWKINELIKVSSMTNDDIKIKCGANTYQITIKKA